MTCSDPVAMASNGDLQASLNHQGTGPGGQWGFQQSRRYWGISWEPVQNFTG